MSALHLLTDTDNSKLTPLARFLAGAPLLAFGVLHLTSVAPAAPLMEAAGLPLPQVLGPLASLTEIAAGVLLLTGLLARLGGVLAMGTMSGAIFTHLKIPSDGWPASNGGPQEPPLIYLAIVIALLGLFVAVKGGGAFSVDRKKRSPQKLSPDGAPSPA